MLLGDIGATNARIALSTRSEFLVQHEFKTQNFNSLTEVIEQFFAQANIDGDLKNKIDMSCFGVAGPVRGGEAFLTNVGWSVSERELETCLDAPSLIVNDFYAQAAAVPHLEKHSLFPLCGRRDHALQAGQTVAVMGAGSGLGQALLISSGQSDLLHARLSPAEKIDRSDQWFAIATEGGHARFAPRDEVEIGLSRWLKGYYGEHVSVERVVSGPGIVDLFKYLLGSRSLPEYFETPITGEQISEAALNQTDPTAVKTMSYFISAYADEAANFALKSNAGTVILSGGIAPQIIPLLQEYFPPHFIAKGRYQTWLERVGVWVVTEKYPAMIGARALALRLC